MRASVDVLGPSEAARHLGISAKALRIYEERGLLRPTRSATGWRAYGPDDVRRAAEIVALRSLGFSLSQVERVLSGVAEGLEPALGALQARLELEFDQLSQRLEKISALRRALAQGEMPAPDVALFHSRQIGYSANKVGSSSRQSTVPIRAGARVTGKVGGLNVGLMNVQYAVKDNIVH